MLWRDVVFDSPENWNELQFDLASDPRHLLGSIAASKTLSFSVHVFTTANDLSKARKLLENERAQAVAQALLLHAGRCTSIVFDLTYASSLPSAAPFLARAHPLLTDLILDYQIYDLPMCYEGTQIKTKPLPLPLSRLSKMSMCGSAFMDIIHLGTEWLQAQSGNNQAHSRDESTFLTIRLRDFEFPDGYIDKEYTFANFTRLLHFISPRTQSLHVEHISLDYYPHTIVKAAGRHKQQDMDLYSLILENVSGHFIKELFQTSNLNGLDRLHFISCSIPLIRSHTIHCSDIILSDVPTRKWSSSLSDDDCDSPYNLIISWFGGNLTLSACPTFDDDFIYWLAFDGIGHGKCPGNKIRSLHIEDCQDFTASAIRHLVATINDPLKENEFERMEILTVRGKGPILKDEDVLWFENYQGKTSVIWHVENDDGHVVNREFRRP